MSKNKKIFFVIAFFLLLFVLMLVMRNCSDRKNDKIALPEAIVDTIQKPSVIIVPEVEAPIVEPSLSDAKKVDFIKKITKSVKKKKEVVKVKPKTDTPKKNIGVEPMTAQDSLVAFRKADSLNRRAMWLRDSIAALDRRIEELSQGKVDSEYTKKKAEKIPYIHYLPWLGLKTNLLAWLALTPNVELEYYFGSHYSIALGAYYANWLSGNYFYQHRGYLLMPEFRYWFKSDTYHNHFVGLYGQYAHYNIKYTENGQQGNAWGVGLSYGYVAPISKCLDLEFSLGIGYLRTKYDEYTMFEKGHYPYKRTVTKEYWGPTSAKISLVYRFTVK